MYIFFAFFSTTSRRFWSPCPLFGLYLFFICVVFCSLDSLFLYFYFLLLFLPRIICSICSVWFSRAPKSISILPLRLIHAHSLPFISFLSLCVFNKFWLLDPQTVMFLSLLSDFSSLFTVAVVPLFSFSLLHIFFLIFIVLWLGRALCWIRTMK